jgi:hypothetical protein
MSSVPLDIGYTIATGLGALAAIGGGLVAHRYEHLLERRTIHVESLRDKVLRPWQVSVNARLSNLSGQSPFLGLDYATKDYQVTRGPSMYGPESPPLAEEHLLVLASKQHWPVLWKTWDALNAEFERVGQRAIEVVRKIESRFPPLPTGKEWAHYQEDPQTAVRLAVVYAWMENSRLFERATYPNYAKGRFAHLGLWRGDGSLAERNAYAALIWTVFEDLHAEIAAVESLESSLASRYKELLRSLEDSELSGELRGRCKYCPRMTTPV